MIFYMSYLKHGKYPLDLHSNYDFKNYCYLFPIGFKTTRALPGQACLVDGKEVAFPAFSANNCTHQTPAFCWVTTPGENMAFNILLLRITFRSHKQIPWM